MISANVMPRSMEATMAVKITKRPTEDKSFTMWDVTDDGKLIGSYHIVAGVSIWAKAGKQTKRFLPSQKDEMIEWMKSLA